MPNEPAFDSAKQIQVAGALGLDHVEAQAAFSVSNHIGFVGGAYKAYKGVNIYEAGINFYTPIEKNSTDYFSFSAGVGKGSYNGKSYSQLPIILNEVAYVNTKYTTAFMQMAFVLNRKTEKRFNKTILMLKCEAIHFSLYNFEVTHLSGTSYYYYTIKMEAKNKIVCQYRPSIIHYFQKTNSIFYWQIQYGLNLIDGFKIKNIQTVTGNYKTDERVNYETVKHARTSPLFFNIALGLKIN